MTGKALRIVAAIAAIGLVACSDEGAKSDNGFTQQVRSAGAPGTPGAFALTVSGALPATGNGVITGSGAAAMAAPSTLTRVSITGSTTSGQHRVEVLFDPVSRTVLSVAHAWGVDTSGTEAATGCVGTVTVAGEHPCGNTVSVDPTTRTVSFDGTLLRGQGTFQSILTGQVLFTAQ